MAALDIWIFRAVNSQAYPKWLDTLMLTLSGEVIWIALFVFCLGYGLIQQNKPLLLTCLLIAVAMGISDYLAYNALKPSFGRFRPCHFLDQVRVVAGCGGRFSFPSNHASNGMAAAVTILLSGYKLWGRVMLAAVAVIGFSRVYLGVHYPGDILAGFVFGAAVAGSVVWTARKLGFPLHHP